MWENSKITQLLNISLPFIQAPMAGGATTPELIAAVSNAGALGSLGAGYLTADALRTAIQRIRYFTDQPFAINLFIPEKYQVNTEMLEQARQAVESSCQELNLSIAPLVPPYAPAFDEQMEIILSENIRILSFTFGILPETWLLTLKKNGVKLIGNATTLQEAEMLAAQGVDMIVAQGSEAGGHRGTFLGKAEDALIKTNSLVPLLAQQIKIPIIAAGGIMSAQDIFNALQLGAAGVQMGTAFLCCPESGIHPLYKNLLLTIKKDCTTLTRAFSGKLARGIRNQFIDRMTAHVDTILPYPVQNSLTIGMRKEAAKQNNIDFMSMWAGQSAYLCQDKSAAELIKELNLAVMELIEKQ